MEKVPIHMLMEQVTQVSTSKARNMALARIRTLTVQHTQEATSMARKKDREPRPLLAVPSMLVNG